MPHSRSTFYSAEPPICRDKPEPSSAPTQYIRQIMLSFEHSLRSNWILLFCHLRVQTKKRAKNVWMGKKIFLYVTRASLRCLIANGQSGRSCEFQYVIVMSSSDVSESYEKQNVSFLYYRENWWKIHCRRLGFRNSAQFADISFSLGTIDQKKMGLQQASRDNYQQLSSGPSCFAPPSQHLILSATFDPNSSFVKFIPPSFDESSFTDNYNKSRTYFIIFQRIQTKSAPQQLKLI